MSVLSGGFLIWHLYLAASNCTGNEIQKWKFLKYCFEYEGTLDENRDKLQNTYDLGSWRANMAEIMFPIDVNNLGGGEGSGEPIVRVKKGSGPGAKKKKGKA